MFPTPINCSDRLRTLSTLRDPCRTLIPKKTAACLRNMVYVSPSPRLVWHLGWIILPRLLLLLDPARHTPTFENVVVEFQLGV